MQKIRANKWNQQLNGGMEIRSDRQNSWIDNCVGIGWKGNDKTTFGIIDKFHTEQEKIKTCAMYYTDTGYRINQ